MFKVGDKIVCIDNLDGFTGNKWLGLTYCKIYENIQYKGPVSFNFVHIINDRNESQSYHVERFISIKEFRKRKLNKICSESEN